MSPRSWQISRRTMLRGAGTALALPWLESMMPAGLGPAASAARKAAGPPLRLGIYAVSAGTVIESWKPQQEGKLPEKLPSVLRPLERHRDDLLILSGLSYTGSGEGGGGHGSRRATFLTGAPHYEVAGGKATAGVSVDQKVAQAIGANTYLASLEIGGTPGFTEYSFRDKTTMVPREDDPRLIYERMFRGRDPMVPNWNRRAAHQARQVRKSHNEKSLHQSSLDAVIEQANRLRGRLGGADKKRLDQYLSSVRTIEKQMEFVERQAAERKADFGGGPAQVSDPMVPEQIHNGEYNYGELRSEIGREPELFEQYMDLLGELMVLAFQTDTTRVVTLAEEGIGQWPGVVTVGWEKHWHSLQHNGNGSSADPIAREGCRQVHEWFTQIFARAVDKMKVIDEGGSTLLDNTLLMYSSYMANGGHSQDDYPVMLVGNAQGTLKPGRHIAYPMKTPLSNLHLECLHRMGVEADEFGETRTSDHAAFNGRLPGLA